ncbi:MAG: Multidrug efflux pump subunit AcrA [Phycisphaerae bacterium]|nr:Multidrug efflux pump subunit AcrA [Phycisphaerae bacterium]
MLPPPATVTVARPVQASVIEWDEFTGRLEAVESVEVRARVGGLITAARFQEGSIVESGDLMVEIDARPYQAALDARLAEAAGARAQVKLAQIEHDRIAGIPESARSNTEFDNAAAMLERAKALLAAAEAQVAAARLDVEWCRVTAPISGRVSKKYVTPGNLITGGNGQGTLLTTITSVDPIHCYVNCDERSVLKYTKLARTGERVSARHARIPTAIQLADETGYPHVGEVDFVDNRVDPDTGTIRGRGVFPNPDGAMIPGFFARVIIPGSGRYEAILVPDSAVVTDQNAKLLMVVDPDNVVHPRPVVLGAIFGELRAVKSGIGPEDRVIINGLMHARPGATVRPVETSIPPEKLPRDIPGVPEPSPEVNETSNGGAAEGSGGGAGTTPRTTPARPEGDAP